MLSKIFTHHDMMNDAARGFDANPLYKFFAASCQQKAGLIREELTDNGQLIFFRHLELVQKKKAAVEEVEAGS